MCGEAELRLCMGGLRAADGAQLALSVAQMAVGSPARKLVAASSGIRVVAASVGVSGCQQLRPRRFLIAQCVASGARRPPMFFDSDGPRRPAFRISFLGSARAGPYRAVRVGPYSAVRA